MSTENSPGPPTSNGRLSLLNRFIWSCVVLIGGLGSVIQFLTISAKHERLFEDILGDRNKLPVVVQGAIFLQRFMAETLFPLGIFVLLPLATWVWFSCHPKAVRIVVISVVGLLFAQGLISVLITGSYIPSLMRSLSGP